jgi:anti-anti-sigma factor
LWIKTESRPGDVITVVKVRGEIDVDSSRVLDHHLHARLARGSRFAIVDLTGVTVLGAPGIRVLIEHSIRLTRTDRRMLTVGSTPHILRLLRISSVSIMLECYPSIALAVAACLVVGTSSAGDAAENGA